MSKRPSVAEVTAVILAGGLGTRLREAVPDRPKPLAWVAGRPFVCHLLEWLERAGVRHCVLALCHQPEKFMSRLGDSYGAMKLDYTIETEPLGTGGAVRLAAEKSTTPLTLVLNGDSYCEFKLRDLVSAHPKTKEGVTMVMARFPGGSSRFGSVRVTSSGKISGFVEKKSASARDAGINAGIYLANTPLFYGIKAGRKISLEWDVFPAWAKAGKMRAFATDGRFIDIGVPASFVEAQTFFRPNVTLNFAPLSELRRSNPKVDAMFKPRTPKEINGWKVAVGVIVRDLHGRILLERREDCGLWGLLGGRMDFGESIAHTAVREVKEETGLDICIERFVGAYSEPSNGILSYPNGDVVQAIVFVVEASVVGGAFSASHESLELRYFEVSSLPRLAMPHSQTALRDCLAGQPPIFG